MDDSTIKTILLGIEMLYQSSQQLFQADFCSTGVSGLRNTVAVFTIF